MTSTIRDLRGIPFAQVESELLRDPTITPQCKALYSLLVTYGPERIFPGHNTLAKAMGFTRMTVIRWLAELRELGLIDWETKPGSSNEYSILGYANLKGCNTGDTPGVTPVIQGVYHPHDTGCNTDDTRSISSYPDSSNEIREEDPVADASGDSDAPPVDYLPHAAEIHKKTGGKKSYTVPADAGGEDLFEFKPFLAFCALIRLPWENVNRKDKLGWTRSIRYLAEKIDATPDELAEAIKAIPHSDFSWQTFNSPYSESFKRTVTVLAGQIKGGIPVSKSGNHSRGPPQTPMDEGRALLKQYAEEEANGNERADSQDSDDTYGVLPGIPP